MINGQQMVNLLPVSVFAYVFALVFVFPFLSSVAGLISWREGTRCSAKRYGGQAEVRFFWLLFFCRNKEK